MKLVITAIYFAVFSFHTDAGPGCRQNNNPAIGIEAEINRSSYMALAFPNSNSRQSVLVAKQEKYYFYGLVSGYNDSILPFIAPKLTLGPVDVSCLTDLQQAVCAATLKWRF